VALIEPLLPNKPRGVARVDDRRVVNGISRPDCALECPAPHSELFQAHHSAQRRSRHLSTTQPDRAILLQAQTVSPSLPRFDKLARNFLAAVLIASTRLWLRAYESTP
jgi:transposase